MDSKQLIKYYDNIGLNKQFTQYFDSVYKAPNYYTYMNILDFIYGERMLDSKNLVNKKILIDKFMKCDFFNKIEINKLISKMFSIYRLNASRNIKINIIDSPQFIAKGKYGHAYLSNNIVIKYFENKNNALHEALIGEAINSLCYKTPNFVYIYGLVPVNIQNEFEYPGALTMEYVKGACMIDWIKQNPKEKDILNIIYQVLYTIYVSYKHINFSHNDLHLSNIMIQKYDNYQILNYDNEFSIRSKYVAKIIDFSLSVAYYKNTQIHNGRDDNKNIGTLNIGTPLNDVVRFICSIITKVSGEFKDMLINSINELVTFKGHNDIVKYKNRFCPLFIVESEKNVENIEKIIEKIKKYKSIKIHSPENIDSELNPQDLLETYKPFIHSLNKDE